MTDTALRENTARADTVTGFALPAFHRRLREEVREFAQERVAPSAYEYDRRREMPLGLVAEMGAMGLFGLPIPVEYGGRGRDYFALCLAVEELARVDQSLAVTLEAGVGLGMMPILRRGTEEQKREWLPLLASGSALGAFGLTEAEAGSDAAGTLTTARLEGGEWVIDGTKQFITNSGSAITRLVTVTAVTGESRRADGSIRKELSAILVPVPTAGFTALPAYDKVGWHGSDTHPLLFEGVRVPERNLLGERGRGFVNFLQTLDEGRVAFAALCVGAAQGCLDEAVRHAGSRRVFGRLLGQNQSIAFTLARMQARVHTARLAYYDAAAKLVAGAHFTREASIAKLVGSEAAMDNARDAAQILGGYGYLNSSPVARHYRDSKILEIGEGTSQVQLAVIARALGFDAL